MLNLQQVKEIVAQVAYRDWQFYVDELRDRSVFEGIGDVCLEPPPPAGFYLQVRFKAKNAKTGELETQNCRKWFISKYSAPAELIRTAYKAVHAAVAHEADEQFLYKGHAIYNPHLDPDILIGVADAQVFRKPKEQ